MEEFYGIPIKTEITDESIIALGYAMEVSCPEDWERVKGLYFVPRDKLGNPFLAQGCYIQVIEKDGFVELNDGKNTILYGDSPCIAINSLLDPVIQLYTLFHELAHHYGKNEKEAIDFGVGKVRELFPNTEFKIR